MSPLLVALLGVLLIPLFVATWRTSLLGLSLQGILLALISSRLHPSPSTVGDWLTLGDLALVRGAGVPLAFYAVLRARKTPARSDVIPPNLLSWTMALAFVLASFSFAEGLVSEPGDQRTLVAVSVAAVLLGFLVLAGQSGPFGQMVGALRVENGIALLEIGSSEHHSPLGVQLGLLTVFVATAAYFRWFLGHLQPTAPGDARLTDPEGPAL